MVYIIGGRQAANLFLPILSLLGPLRKIVEKRLLAAVQTHPVNLQVAGFRTT
jgi:hypothetical protein